MLDSTVVLVSKCKAVKYLVACRRLFYVTRQPRVPTVYGTLTGTPNISKGEGYQATCTVLVVLDISRPGGRSRTLGYMYGAITYVPAAHSIYVAPLYSTRPGAT